MTSGSPFPPWHRNPPSLGDRSQRCEQLQDQLAQMEAKQHQFLDALPITVWQADVHGQLTFLNANWQTLTGRSPDTDLGWRFLQAVPLQECDRIRNQWQTTCQISQSFVISFSLSQRDGTCKPCRAQGEPILDKQGQLLGWAGTILPAPNPINTHTELDDNPIFLEALLDNLSNGIVACNAQGVLTLFNRATQEMHGIPLRSIPPEQWTDYYDLYQADGETLLTPNEVPLYRALQGESVYNAEMIIRPKQGQPRTILANGDPIIAKDGRKLGAVVAMRDITLRKQALLELRKSEERWQLALKGTGDGIFDWNIVTNEAFLSPQLKQTLGYADHEIANSFAGWQQLVHADDLEQALAAVQTHLQHITPCYAVEYRMCCKDGSHKWILARGQAKWDKEGQPVRMVGSHQDITRRKQAEMELARLNQELEGRVAQRTNQLEAANYQKDILLAQEREARHQSEAARAQIELYENIIQNIQLGFLVWHSVDLSSADQLQLVAANPAAERTLDTKLQGKLGMTIGEVLPNFMERQATTVSSLVQVIQTQQPRTLENVVFTLPQGGERIFSLKAFPLPDTCVGVAFENVTARRQTEAALSRSEQRYRTVVDSVKEVIFQTDTHGCWTFLNSVWTDITGYAIHESLGKSLTGLVVKEADQRKWRDLFDSFVREEKTVLNHKVEIVTKTEQRRWLEVRVVPFPNEDGFTIGTFGTINDVTELQQQEANLQAQTNQLIHLNAELTQTATQLKKRNQELDQFAYVTSHDLKAPLRAVSNLSEWIEEDLEDHLTGDTRDQMDLLRSRILRMENLINGLLAYSRAGRLQEKNQIVDVAQLVSEVLDSLDVPETFEVRIDGSLPQLETRALPLQQVFANLINNAVKHHDQGQGVIKITAQDQGNHYLFKVKDDGPGIESRYHGKVFTIFQTLQARDSFESTGIGLSIVKKIVEAQGGTIEVRSQLGAGATFIFTWLK